jgi:hypothetical protein
VENRRLNPDYLGANKADMTLQMFIARFLSISLLITAVSHAAQPRLWRDFFLMLKGTGVAGIIIAMYTLPLGLVIVLGHNIWVFDVPVIVTICGWGMVIKSVIYALFPSWVDRVIPVGEKAHRKYALGGGLMIPLSLLLVYYAFFRMV